MSANKNATAKFTFTCVVPNVHGMALAAAKSAILAAHCGVGPVTKKHSNTVPSGSVISQSPGAGKQFKKGTKISLKVSLGHA
jgi:serine/threonine-protein kinase